MKNIIPSVFISLALCWTPANAAFDSANILNPDTKRNVREEILKKLEDPKVATELHRLGVEKSEVKLRLAAMSDQELNQVSQQTMQQAGGDNVVISATALIIILLVLILIT